MIGKLTSNNKEYQLQTIAIRSIIAKKTTKKSARPGSTWSGLSHTQTSTQSSLDKTNLSPPPVCKQYACVNITQFKSTKGEKI